MRLKVWTRSNGPCHWSLITESSDFGLKPTDRTSTKDCLAVQVNSSSHWSIDPFPTGDAGVHCPGTLVGGIRLRVLLLACRAGRLDGYRKNILEGPRRWSSPDCWGSWTVNPVLTSMLVPFQATMKEINPFEQMSQLKDASVVTKHSDQHWVCMNPQACSQNDLEWFKHKS